MGLGVIVDLSSPLIVRSLKQIYAQAYVEHLKHIELNRATFFA